MLKRCFDFFIALTALLLLLPFLAIVAILIKLDSKGPVLFLQKRVGRYDKEFLIYKFRTMQSFHAQEGLKITVGSDSRITKIGYILRKYKIDELPQLANVVLGQMSLVGPRPEVREYVNHYKQSDKDIILSVHPGITDIASIRFRDESGILANESNPQQAYIKKIMPKKLRYCRFYVKHQSFLLDIKIILMTIRAIFT